MITRSPYGIAGASSRFTGDVPLRAEEPRTYDPPEKIQLCLSCPKEDCVGMCPYTSMGALRRVDKIENDPMVERVANMILAGWRLEPLARELGMTVSQVKYKKKQAISIGLLG